MTAPTWTGDDVSLAVWAALGGTSLDIDEDPETVIDRLRTNGYTWTAAADELGISPDMRRELAIAAAWAGIARVALRRRDDAIRACATEGAPSRNIGAAVGMSHEGVRQIIDREHSPRGRW